MKRFSFATMIALMAILWLMNCLPTYADPPSDMTLPPSDPCLLDPNLPQCQ
jgi:hypothetical protein